MNEAEFMRKQGLLFTAKQYKKCRRLIVAAILFGTTMGGGLLSHWWS